MVVSIITAPLEEPLCVTEAQAQLQLDTDDYNDYLIALITTARQWAENFTNRAFITQTLELKLDSFATTEEYSSILIPKPPLQAVNSIQYVDINGDTQTFSSSKYVVDTKSTPGKVYPAYNESWPSTQNIPNAVTINYDAGYGGQSAINEDLKQALKIIVSDLFRNRESNVQGRAVSDLPFQHENLLANYKVHCFG